MINNIIDFFSGVGLKAIDGLPDVDTFSVPNGVYDGIDTVFGFVGYIMPYSLYSPLITFILSLVAFRIAYAIYLHFKK